MIGDEHALKSSVARRLVKVVVVEDHEVTRQGIKASLVQDGSIRVVGEAAGSNEAISLIAQLKPDVAIVDIRLSQGNGIDVSKGTKTIAPVTKILVLSAFDDDRYVNALAKVGVSGYLLKTVSADDLRRAVHYVTEGWLVFAPEVACKVSQLVSDDASAHPRQAPGTRRLTSREVEVLNHMSRGLRNSEIARALGIAVKTVEAHIESVLNKMGARSRTEAVATALQDGRLHHPFPDEN